MSKRTKLSAEEKAKMQEEERIKRQNQIMSLYKSKEGVEVLAQDKKNTYLHNPDNDRLLKEVVENSKITIDLRAYTDIFIMDIFMEKPKNFITMIKRISGKDLTNPRFKDKHLILSINGDAYYGLSEQRKKYYLLKELSRLTWNEEKEQYKVLKYEYQNNENLIDLYGVHPTEESIADL